MLPSAYLVHDARRVEVLKLNDLVIKTPSIVFGEHLFAVTLRVRVNPPKKNPESVPVVENTLVADGDGVGGGLRQLVPGGPIPCHGCHGEGGPCTHFGNHPECAWGHE